MRHLRSDSVWTSCCSLIRMLFLTGCFSAGLVFGDPVADNSKILIIGPAADTHATALQGLIAGDSTANALNITVDSFPTDDLLLAYYQNYGTGLRNDPSESNPLLDKLAEGFDVILIHPGERHIRLGPELHMEGVRLLERHVREQGPRILLLVPTFDPAYSLNYKNPSTFTQVKERVYRIKDALDLEAVPVGITWEAVLADAGITATDTTVSAPNIHAVNTYATTLFSALFEASPASSTYRHGGIPDAEYGLISAHAFQTWQSALTATHYTGDYVGIFSPMPTAYDPLAKKTVWGGASTEGITAGMFSKIYRRKGIDVLPTERYNSTSDLAEDFDFCLTRGHFPDYLVDYYQYFDPGNDLRVIGMNYKAGMLSMRQWALSMAGDARDWYDTSSFVPTDSKRFVPNFLAFSRHWLEDNFPLGRYGDSHMNDDATMIQSGLVYTIMSGGEHPLSGDINLHAWTGRQRYAATMGYAMVMGIGRLKKLEMPPVSKGFLRYEMLPDTANPLTLEGIDFNGLPLSAEIVTPPAHGTLNHLGGTDFTYTPDPGFNGIDFVTYRVNNGEASSLPLTIALPIAPYTPAPPQGTVFFEEDFDDQTFEGWATVGTVFLVTDTQNQKTNWTNGFKRPFDGTAALSMDAAGSAEQAVDTRGYENLHLTIRVGSGTWGFNSSSQPDEADGAAPATCAEVEWFDGTTWHPLISHGDRYQTNQLLDTYEVALPAGASNNPDFALRLKRVSREAHFDSIRLSGDFIYDPNSLPPVVEAGSTQTVTAFGTEAAWAPGDLNVAFWVDASDASSLQVTDGKISQWSDKSDGGFHLTQADATKRPVPSTHTINGLPTVTFDGTDDQLITTGHPFGSSIGDALVMMVFHHVNNNTLFNLSGRASPNHWTGASASFAVGNTTGSRLTKIGGSGPTKTDVMFSFYNSPTEQLQEFRRSGDTVMRDETGHILADPSHITVGSGENTSYMNYHLAEMIVLQGTVDTEQRLRLEGYLAHKWGLNGNLNEYHPWGSIPPPAVIAQTTLQGTVTDPDGPLLFTSWEKVSGPGEVLFADATALNTTVTFSAPGEYTLQLTGFDLVTEVADQITITVQEYTGLTPEQQYYVDSGLPSDTDSADDADEDGVSNGDEFIAGTNPNDAASRFEVVGAAAPGGLQLQSPRMFGKYYRVCHRASLTEGDWTPLEGYEGILASDGSPLDLEVETDGFYRLEVSDTAWP